MRSHLNSARSRLDRLQGRMEDRLARNSRRRSSDELVAKLHAARARAAQGIFSAPLSEEEWRERGRSLRRALDDNEGLSGPAPQAWKWARTNISTACECCRPRR